MASNEELSIDINGLRRLYNKDTCAKAVLDHLESRKHNSTETTVDRLESVLGGSNPECSRRELVGALRELAALRCGQFIIGRRGQPSRFRWDVQMIDVGRAAKGTLNTVPPLRAEEAQPEDAEETDLEANTIRHTFNLRPDYTITIDLPSDFSGKEANRLSEFIKTLPFDQD